MFAFSTALRRFRPDTVYLNSMFSVAGTLWPLFWLWIIRSQIGIVLAPRGMLKHSALARKRWKKLPILLLLRCTGMARQIQFQATSDDEVAEIQKAFGDVAVTNIPNVPIQPIKTLCDRMKTTGVATCCFVGRIHPIKNLLWLLEVLEHVKGQMRLTVVGPPEDHTYFLTCQKVASELPVNIRVDFVGPVPEAEVRLLLSNSDAMILPTEGENFGHAIFEALSVGTPVIISDRTIWRNLFNQCAGWDLELGNRELFKKVLEDFVQLENPEYQKLRQGALRSAHLFFAANNFKNEFCRLFAAR